jgi:ABC-type oligopeptide transport system substrate-binding subunit
MGEIVGANAYKAGKASDVSGVKVLNSSTIRISLGKPYAYFLKTFTYQTSWPLDPTVLQGKTAAPLGNFLTNDCPGNQGAGPFTFVCFGNRFYASGQSPSYTLVPNKFWWGRKPHVKIVIRSFSSLEDGYKAYKLGQLDLVSIPTAFVVQERKNTKEFHEFPTSVVRYFVPNTNKAPMNDVHCRLAAAYAIDRNKLANTILHGTVNIIYDVVPPGFLSYYDGKDNPHFNPKKAKAEFGKCRSKSVPMKLTYPTGSSDSDRTFSEANRELQAVGFKSAVNPISANDWFSVVSQLLDNSNTQFVMGGWQQDYPDPQDYVSILLRCGSDYNIGLWCSKTFSNLVDRADMESNPRKRAQLYIRAQHLAIGQGAWITLWNTESYELIKPYVRGMTGGVAYADIVPKNYDWSNVTVGNH